MKIDESFDLIAFLHDFFITDDEEMIAAFASHLRLEKKEKGEIIFHPKATDDSTTFLLDGVLRTYILSPDGAEHTMTFWYQPGIAICVTQEMITIPEIWCETVTPCTILNMVDTSPYKMAEEYPILWKELMYGSLPFAGRFMDKARVGYTLDAKDRYLWFLDKYAPIADVVPQSIVASYLGIKPQSLSRIRTELLREGALPLSPKDEKSFSVKP